MGMSEYRDKADTSRCYFCPKRNDIEVHHIVPQRFNGSDSRENLVALCDRCHRKIEALYDKRFYERLGIADETGDRKAHFECVGQDCQQRAQVRLKNEAGFPRWNCLDCATRTATRTEITIIEDMTDKFQSRLEWVETAKAHNKLKSTSLY
jgi:hypothetical protein